VVVVVFLIFFIHISNGYSYKAFQPMGIYLYKAFQLMGISFFKAFQPMGIYLYKAFQKPGSMTSINKEHTSV
jgi:hypothetical protein